MARGLTTNKECGTPQLILTVLTQNENFGHLCNTRDNFLFSIPERQVDSVAKDLRRRSHFSTI